MIHDLPSDRHFGSQMQQLIQSITSTPSMWSHPLFLPYLILQNYGQRLSLSQTTVSDSLVELENKLGVTHAGRSWLDVDRTIWPQDIDIREMTIALHSFLPHTIFLLVCCRWAQEYGQFLLDQEQKLSAEGNFQQLRPDSPNVTEAIRFHQSVASGLESRFTLLKERAALQVNVLFSVISQQDSFLNRWDSRLNHLVARSTKQDSISMTTFTFITALFLPGTFVATLLSMSMFDFQPDNTGAPSMSSASVSSTFWLFWAIAVPLTLATMGGWYIWRKDMDRRWNKELLSAAADADSNVPTSPVKAQGNGHLKMSDVSAPFIEYRIKRRAASMAPSGGNFDTGS